jgi:hypothetical protein
MVIKIVACAIRKMQLIIDVEMYSRIVYLIHIIHATTCRLQLVQSNYKEFQLHVTIAKIQFFVNDCL